MKRYNCNETIYKQGEVPYNLYILLSGQLKQIGQKHTQIMDCSVGEFIGAHANFANICYFETMQAFTPSEILVINFDYMQKKLEQHQNILDEISENLVKKRNIIINIIELENIVNTIL